MLVVLPFFVLPKYFAKAVLELNIDSAEIYLDSIKPYWGVKSKEAIYIRLDELKSYKYEPSYNFTASKLKLKSGRKIKLHRWYLDEKDDFDKFMTQFRQRVENYNKKKSTIIPIEEEKLIMENRTFLISIALLIGAIIMAGIVLIFLKGINNWKGIISILIVIGPLIWVINQVVSGLRNQE